MKKFYFKFFFTLFLTTLFTNSFLAQNTPPTFTSTAVTLVYENETYNYNILTNDVDGDAITVTAPTIPSWLSLSTNMDGVVTTLAGSTSGFADGTGASAQFNIPYGVAVDASGNVYVADINNHKVRKITPTGVVTTLAGSSTGYADGTGDEALFNKPARVAVDISGNVYVADSENQKIRKITPVGEVTTLAGSTLGYADGTGAAAQFNYPYGVAVDGSGNVYVADSGNQKIRKISLSGVVTTLAGSTAGYADGTGAAAQFNNPFGVTVDGSGNVYVADLNNQKIRKITSAGVVTTLAGSTGGYADGTGAAAQFGNPFGVTVDGSGNVYVADSNNNKIRKITSVGEVTTLAGSTFGYSDGTGADAQFALPIDVAIDVLGNIFVADFANYKIRKITTAGTLLTGDTTGQVGTHNVVLNANDGNGGSINQNFTITVNSALSINDEMLTQGIKFYPNPTKGNIDITLPFLRKEVSIEIYNIQSQLLSAKTYTINDDNLQLNIDEYPAGLYFLKINLDMPVTIKIIKR